MKPHRSTLFIALACLLVPGAFGQTPTLAARLGYPPDSKLLIIHADDLAVAHSQDMASFAALNSGAASSASIMVPCPWLTEVAEYAKAHPDADLGLHLTLTSEWKTYRWGPVAPRDQVPSLLDSQGYLWSEAGPAVKNVKPEEAEREIRAQIETAIRGGIHPTHLDSHMGTLFANPGLFAVLVKVAHEYKLPFLYLRLPGLPAKMYDPLQPTDVALTQVYMVAPNVKAENWLEYYDGILKTLKPGVSELIVHLAFDNDEMQAITRDHPDYGSAWRQRDFNVITSPEFRKALEENHISLVHWKDLGKLLP